MKPVSTLTFGAFLLYGELNTLLRGLPDIMAMAIGSKSDLLLDMS